MRFIRHLEPWVNVVANSNFGFLVSESGAGFTWSENSHENQLTPAAGAAPMKLSLNVPQVGSRCAALNPTALANPTRIAARGAHRLPRKTRTTVIAAVTP